MIGLRRLAAPPPFELWIADLDAPGGDSLDTLDANERARAAAFVFDKHRRHFVAAHRALRAVLAKRTGTSAAALRFGQGPHGKPQLIGDARCAFNLSHCDGVALILLAIDGEVGVDVELLHHLPDRSDLARHNFTADEQRELEATTEASRDLAFLLGWTRKEACLKALGTGLSVAPQAVNAGVVSTQREVRIDTADGAATVALHSFVHDDRIICALARVLRAPQEQPADPPR